MSPRDRSTYLTVAATIGGGVTGAVVARVAVEVAIAFGAFSIHTTAGDFGKLYLIFAAIAAGVFGAITKHLTTPKNASTPAPPVPVTYAAPLEHSGVPFVRSSSPQVSVSRTKPTIIAVISCVLGAAVSSFVLFFVSGIILLGGGYTSFMGAEPTNDSDLQAALILLAPQLLSFAGWTWLGLVVTKGINTKPHYT